ncbi:hypothetical protein QUF51_09935 [Bacillus pumilus]|nr:hypothetical protein [Bacillus pumilus]OLP65041.1 hypothetical protein BACPU_19970 [Bacillus pumilus]
MIQYDQIQLIRKALASTAKEIEVHEIGQISQLAAARHDLALAQAYKERSEHAFLMKECYHHRLRS